MKISTLALGALISFSFNALAQDKPKVTSKSHTIKTVGAKPTKCKKPKPDKVKVDTSSLIIHDNVSPHICYACGRG